MKFPSSLAAVMLTKQAKGRVKITSHSQAAARSTNAEERNMKTLSREDTDHKHSVHRTQKEYSTEPMSSQMNRLMSHAAPHTSLFLNNKIRRSCFHTCQWRELEWKWRNLWQAGRKNVCDDCRGAAGGKNTHSRVFTVLILFCFIFIMQTHSLWV